MILEKLDNSIISLMDIMKEEKSNHRKFIEGLADKGEVVALVGPSDTGKSMLLRHLSTSVINGDDNFLGYELNPEYRKVIYFSSEDSKEKTREIYCKMLQGDISNSGNMFFDFSIENPANILKQFLETHKCDLIIIDCFTDYFTSDINKSTEVRSFLLPYKKIAAEFNCLIIFLHHTGKNAEKRRPDKNSILGSQAIEGSMRLVLELRNHPSRNDLKCLTILKGNYISNEMKKKSSLIKFEEESLLFEDLEEKITFSELIPDDKDSEEFEKYKIADSHFKMGLSYEEISKLVGYSSKGSVSKLLKKGEIKSWDRIIREDIDSENDI